MVFLRRNWVWKVFVLRVFAEMIMELVGYGRDAKTLRN